MYKIVVLGSTNQTKVNAVKETLDEFPELFHTRDVMPIKASSDVPEQPIGFDEIISGAKNRARMAYMKSRPDLSIGLEDGICEIPHTHSGYMNFCACALYDGHDFVVALSGGYEYPRRVIDKILNEDKNITEAFFELGLSEKEDLGAQEGAIGVMSNGRENRVDGTRIALRRALMKLENKDML